MLCITRLRQKIVALTVLTLVVSIVKIVYEFHSAQHSVDLSDRDTAPDIRPFAPHLLATTADLRSKLSLRAHILWTASRGRNKFPASRADTKIDSDKTRYILHAQHGYNATSLPEPSGDLVSAVSLEWVSSVKNTRPYLVIIVCSKPENTQLRLAIRRSWALELDKPDVVLRFFVGHDDGWDDIIEREQALHSDVIRTEYVDSYENLSYKVLAAISWALHSLGPPRYIMKIDDDTYVNLPYLLHELHNKSVIISDATRRYVMGAVCLDSPVVRDDGDKWFVSHLDYPNDVYPTYVFGGGYVMTRAAAESVLAASLKTEYLHLEDVFITGILARAAGVGHVSHPGFAFWTSRSPSPCDVVTGRRLTAVNLTSKQFYVMYSGIHAILRTGNWTKC